jgi:hypothetical protein
VQGGKLLFSSAAEHKVIVQGGKLLFSSAAEHKVMECDYRADGHVKVKPLGGSDSGYNNGPATVAKFRTPHGICVEGKTIFVTDPTSERVALIVPLHGTTLFLQKVLGKLCDAFDIHIKHQATDHIDINHTIAKLNEVDVFLDEQVNNAKQIQGLSVRLTNLNGPQGTVSTKTRKSVKLLKRGLVQLQENLEPHFAETEVSALLTSCVEIHHAVSHFRHETFSILEHARDSGAI